MRLRISAACSRKAIGLLFVDALGSPLAAKAVSPSPAELVALRAEAVPKEELWIPERGFKALLLFMGFIMPRALIQQTVGKMLQKGGELFTDE